MKTNSQLLKQIEQRHTKWKYKWECPTCGHKAYPVTNPYTGAEDWNGVVVCTKCKSNMRRIT